MAKISYFEFQSEMHGYDAFRKNGTQIYRWELFFSGYNTLVKVKEKFKLRIKLKK